MKNNGSLTYKLIEAFLCPICGDKLEQHAREVLGIVDRDDIQIVIKDKTNDK